MGKVYAVLGTGNIAQTIAVDFKARGGEVRLFAPEKVFYRFGSIAENKTIQCFGALEAREKIDVVTCDIDEAVKGADYIFMCVTGEHHEEYAKLLVGHTTKEQMLITFNGCMASLIYKHV